MDIQTKPRGCTSFKVRQLMRRLSTHYDAEVSKSGLKTTQYSLLSHLKRLGSSRPVDLASELKMTASTLSRNLQPLIAAGFIAQSAGADARSLLVQLTEAGEARSGALFQAVDDHALLGDPCVELAGGLRHACVPPGGFGGMMKLHMQQLHLQ